MNCPSRETWINRENRCWREEILCHDTLLYVSNAATTTAFVRWRASRVIPYTLDPAGNYTETGSTHPSTLPKIIRYAD